MGWALCHAVLHQTSFCSFRVQGSGKNRFIHFLRAAQSLLLLVEKTADATVTFDAHFSKKNCLLFTRLFSLQKTLNEVGNSRLVAYQSRQNFKYFFPKLCYSSGIFFIICNICWGNMLVLQECWKHEKKIRKQFEKYSRMTSRIFIYSLYEKHFNFYQKLTLIRRFKFKQYISLNWTLCSLSVYFSITLRPKQCKHVH